MLTCRSRKNREFLSIVAIIVPILKSSRKPILWLEGDRTAGGIPAAGRYLRAVRDLRQAIEKFGAHLVGVEGVGGEGLSRVDKLFIVVQVLFAQRQLQVRRHQWHFEPADD